MTLVVPGSAQFTCGNRAVGRAAMRIAGLVLATLVVGWFSLGRDGIVALGLDTDKLTYFEAALGVLALGWVALFVDAWRLGRPPSLRPHHRVVATTASLTLMAGVATPMAYGAYLIDLQREVVTQLIVPGPTGELYRGRLNVVLLGGDGGLNRRGIRTDSISLASIDVSSGKTDMFSLPRNLQYAQFPPGTVMAKQFPGGFPDFFFGIYTWAQENRALFPKSVRDPGALAVQQAVAQTLGIPVHYYALVNLSGFQKVIDALGGITIRVEERLPIGGGDNQLTGQKNPILGYIEPGLQRLNGYKALWYARSRSGAANGDYDRMGRQRCVFGALLGQADPLNILFNYQKLAGAVDNVVATDLTSGAVEDLIKVAPKAKKAGVASIAFTNALIDAANPDLAFIRAKVASAIAKSEAAAAAPKPTASATPAAKKKASAPKKKAPAPGQPVELADTCRYK
ncbi:MAG: LCP family protein [Sporichthyaceae bacterium]